MKNIFFSFHEIQFYDGHYVKEIKGGERSE